MYEYLSGMLVSKGEGFCVIDNHGIGYKIHVPKREIGTFILGEERKLYLHHHVKEDEEAFYGFTSIYERDVFELVTNVPGIGVRLGLRCLDEREASEIIKDLYKENILNLKKIKGLGEKLIRKMILELKPKLVEYLTVVEDGFIKEKDASINDLKEALRALGYKEMEIAALLSDFDYSEKGLEENLKLALLQLSKFK